MTPLLWVLIGFVYLVIGFIFSSVLTKKGVKLGGIYIIKDPLDFIVISLTWVRICWFIIAVFVLVSKLNKPIEAYMKFLRGEK